MIESCFLYKLNFLRGVFYHFVDKYKQESFTVKSLASWYKRISKQLLYANCRKKIAGQTYMKLNKGGTDKSEFSGALEKILMLPHR
jgi:hypothetical protein